ncbi:MAG: glycine--tRNA ligase subunit beta [Coriobacteriales bacterium]|jgi:glycyl-tRNA synthetase beta chain
MSERKLVFEIGTEELPSEPLYAATKNLVKQAEDALVDARIQHGEVKTFSTPRRIILAVDGVAAQSDELVMRAKGPAAKIAFDEEGKPTKAALGFARGKGVDVSELERSADEKGVEYVYAVVNKPAEPTIELLPGILSGLIEGISWPRSQRWGRLHVTFARPIRWLCALLGDEVVPVEYAGLKADRLTWGHRLMRDRSFEIASAEDFFDAFDEMRVVPSAKKRAEIIRNQINVVESDTGLRADTPKKTFDEVVNLVEWPTVLVGHFDERFLDVPPEIITDAMLEHQRYFPLYQPDGTLDNAFIIVSNGDPAYNDTITDGNERVVRARLDDAAFFVAEDLHRPLEDYVDDLADVVFQEKLGSVKDKTERIVKLASACCESAGIEGQERKDAQRAAYLCKADLVTSAVVEFTSLQGIMGGHYAKAAGENADVALAITDSYRPRFAGDDLPRNLAGKVVALSDKLDTVCGIFAIGQGPTGSSDPFALRRSAIGIINILLSGLNASLADLIRAALSNYEGAVEFDAEAVYEQVCDFFVTRLEVIARDRGLAPDCIDAVTSIGMFEPAETIARIEVLGNARENDPELFDDLATAYTRAANLCDPSLGTEVDESLMGDAEKTLIESVDEADDEVSEALGRGDHEAAISALAALRQPIDRFFEDVLVMDEDEELRRNRLRALNCFVAVFEDVADIGKLAKK